MSEPTALSSETKAAPAPKRRSKPRGIRRAHMTISKIDPWSTLKVSFLLSVGLGIIGVIATVVMWNVLDSMHVFSSLDELLKTLGSEELMQLMQYLQFGRVMSFAIIVAVLDIVLLTFLGMIMALLYNLIAMLVGGIHITITDE
ncbi:MAG: DUF3566 domain-containing protein [Flaviflexus sp.]|nr:DUF3566 domain-containing protein [Flaviflexus sp.]